MKTETAETQDRLYSMNEVCGRTGLSYETLKFYCNKGLVPNVKRAENNYRVFDDNDIGWIESLKCLKKCGMSIEEMQRYKDLCMEGVSSIPERRKILTEKLALLQKKMEELQASIDFIGWKKQLYDDIESGRKPYVSYLLNGVGETSL
ncbi:MAG: MerR family transcriptional regulator [Treponemataceae bacterium]|nr:MerR family transcriptional regulator [Treponemataceae bacterium]